ncbi:MAG: HAMP domain-containing histidine kinase [Bacteroidales bacterium]|nr:HAMP domain-containing histidine kinase [Bacteroidales bacterium]
MSNKSRMLELRYRKYINDITVKRINIIMIISISLLSLLMYSDLYIRENIIALYSRLPSFILAFVLIVLKNFKIKINISLLTTLYNYFLASIPIMMFAKYLIHIDSGTDSVNVLGIITALFIISLEIRTNLLYTIVIYIIPPILFLIILLSFFSVTNEESHAFINVFLILIAGFTVNRVQNNFRYKAFEADYYLDIEKKKLEQSNEELKIYQEKLEELVEEKTISLQIALKKATESDKLKTSFLQNISHEIRTPINAVLGFMQVLSGKDKSIENEYQIINDNFNVLIKTIEDILFLSELQSEQFEIKKTEFFAQDFINNIYILLQNRIKKSFKKIKPVLDFNKNDNFLIEADGKLLKKAITYIIDNAVKFTDQGEIKLHISLNNENVNINIIDDGQGISEKDLPYIYDSFRKFEDKNTIFSGVGIGMSIAEKLISLLSGEIQISSEKGKGTSVKIVIKEN